MIRLILVRHGNTFEKGEIARQIGARTDLPLTQEGQKQAEELRDYFQAEQIIPTALYAGGLKRQIDSAKIVQQPFSCPLYAGEVALNEIDYGLWEGLRTEEITQRWKEEYTCWTERGLWAENVFPGSLLEHLAQIERWLSSLRKHYRSGDTVIAFSSNGLLRFFHPDWPRFSAQREMDLLKVKTGHFCELSLHPKALLVKAWNVQPQVGKENKTISRQI